jgi:hypothetical protein
MRMGITIMIESKLRTYRYRRNLVTTIDKVSEIILNSLVNAIMKTLIYTFSLSSKQLDEKHIFTLPKG